MHRRLSAAKLAVALGMCALHQAAAQTPAADVARAAIALVRTTQLGETHVPRDSVVVNWRVIAEPRPGARALSEAQKAVVAKELDARLLDHDEPGCVGAGVGMSPIMRRAECALTSSTIYIEAGQPVISNDKASVSVYVLSRLEHPRPGLSAVGYSILKVELTRVGNVWQPQRRIRSVTAS